ncbi:ABC transporter permease [Nocardioides sp. W3-2-3]|uniref:FtsX-like permease family protein n=1 Tax=Nocardioides convexus TaxID=2712224 RepID=UPI00241879EB|nr:ABC transporter permease [Nocardioides convexus]NHA00804.1 ABC transporter permease [Nocardioides convexus]
MTSDADIGQVPDRPEHRWQDVVSGRFPQGPGEALVDSNAAKADDIAIGDRLRIGTGTRALDVRVVGLADSPSNHAVSSVYLLWPDLRRWEDSLYVGSVAWSGGGHDAAASAIRAVVPTAEPETVDAFVQDLQRDVNNGVDVIAIIVLLFTTVALLVAVLVINNTFTILFAQRSRDFALLRCVGATRRQVVRSVRVESLALGIIAAVLGIVAGLGAGHGLVALIHAQWPGARLGDAHIGAGWLLAAAVLAIGVTLVAAWLPTRRVVQVSPLAALRPDDSTRVRTTTGRLRIALGVLLLGAGTAALALAVATAAPPPLVAGGAAVFLGVLMLGPVVVPALIGAAGRLAGRLLGPSGRLAAGNAVRNPRRTAATTASLLVGVTLTTAVLTGLARLPLRARLRDGRPAPGGPRPDRRAPAAGGRRAAGAGRAGRRRGDPGQRSHRAGAGPGPSARPRRTGRRRGCPARRPPGTPAPRGRGAVGRPRRRRRRRGPGRGHRRRPDRAAARRRR